MPRRVPRLLAILLFLAVASTTTSTQSPAFRILEAGPAGQLEQMHDANEIRVVFSEPMVVLGRIPSNPTPAWIHISPTMRGAYRWSGTTILVFTPDPSAPLPFATRYTVTIDRTAESASGHQLGASFEFSFTTPTVKLLEARWARQGNRFDAPIALALTFNQPVRPADVASHVSVRFEPHAWTVPRFSARERARLQANDPEGLRRFDAKVAAAAQAAGASAPVGTTVALNWDRDAFKPSDSLVVLQTTTVPPPGSWLRVTVDARVPSPAGPEAPGQPQVSTHELDSAFFVSDVRCQAECAPSSYNPVEFTGRVDVQAFASALTVQDLSDAAREQPVRPTGTAKQAGPYDEYNWHSVEDAGFARQPPASTWLLHLDGSLRAADGQPLGYPWIGIIENWHEIAFSSFGDGHGVWEKDGGPQLPFYARNLTSVTQWIAPLAPADLMPRILDLEKTSFVGHPTGDGTPRRLNVSADAVQSHGLDLSKTLTPRGTGLIWAAVLDGPPIGMAKSATDDPKSHSAVVQVTNLGVTVKDSPQSTLVFVTRLDNGQPVADARVAIVLRANKAVWNGRTNRDGVALAPALTLRDQDLPEGEYGEGVQYLVTAEKDGDVAYALSTWDEGIEPWAFGIGYGRSEAEPVLRGSVFTDRGLYRPGEEVHFKTILRSDAPTGMRLLADSEALDVAVSDSRGRTLDHRTIKPNRWSSADWTWTVPASGTVGVYQVTVKEPNPRRAASPDDDASARRRRNDDWLREVHGTFTVAAYRRADFRVDTTAAAPEPLAGATIHATLDARYLFGAGMAQRPVRWTWTREYDSEVPTAITDQPRWTSYHFGYYPETTDSNKKVAGNETTLDARGQFAVDLPTEKTTDVSYRYTFEGEVEDVSRQRIANRTSLVVYPAPWFVGLHTDSYFADVKKGAGVDVAVVDRQGAPVSGIIVDVSLIRVQWNSVRHAEGHGFYTWETKRLETPAGAWTITSAATPTPRAMSLTEGGSYIVRATARDQAGHVSRTELYFYGIGEGYTAWERFDHNRIKFEPEKKTWKPGETARLMIQSPWESATALMTVEREGIRHYTQFALTSTQQTVEVPITEADIPNLYVSILLVRGRTSQDVGKDGDDPGKPAFRLGYAELKIEDATKQLKVNVAADRTEYRPANAARVSVAVSDSAGRPAHSEVTLWAVDYGVLSLIGYEPPDLVHSVWVDKQLQVATVDSRQRIISRRVITPKGAGDGGGGGAENGPSGARKDFRPLAFWLGSVETDKSGKATTSVTLPESLTTYRIMAVAGDTDSRFGSTNTEIRVTKPVTLLAAFPRFLSVGDVASFGAVVTNTTPAGGSAVVTVRSLDPGMISFENPTQTMTIGAGASVEARFGAVAHAIGSARVEMTVKLGDNTDAFQATLPVAALAPIETTAAFGDTDSRTAQPLAVPAGAIPTLGGLRVDVASTALVGLGEGVRYLADYQYDCAEQKASSALALLLAADLGQTFSMSHIRPAEYRARGASLLSALPRYQCPDGGFTFWPGMCRTENAYLTAYVLDVMKQADGLGATSDEKVISDALAYLERELKAPTPTPMPAQAMPAYGATMAYMVHVLTAYGRNQDANITRVYAYVDRLPIFALSDLADALAAAKDKGPRYQNVIRSISNGLRIEGDQAHAQEPDDDRLFWLWDSNVRATAIVLDGFVRRADDPVFVQRMVRWLLAARRNGRWNNTQDNILSLRALVAYYKVFEAEPPDMTAKVAIGAAPVATLAFKGRSTSAQSVQVSMQELIDKLAAAPADRQPLSFERIGTGHLYYTARLETAVADPPAASDHGIKVERRYEKFVDGGESPASTSFTAGDLVRVTLTVTLPKERRYVALTDLLPAGFEPVEGFFRTTATDLAREASTFDTSDSQLGWQEFWRHGGFDNVEKYDDRVIVFGTRLGEGRHEFSYVVRATTAGTFKAAGPMAEEMYAPEVNGRATATTIVIR